MSDVTSQTAGTLMTSQVVAVQPNTPIREAIKLVVDGGFSGMPVVDAAGKAVGMITAESFLRAMRIGAETVEAVMSKQVLSVPENATAPEVMKFLTDRSVRRVLVLREEKPVGIITWRDMAGKLMTGS